MITIIPTTTTPTTIPTMAMAAATWCSGACIPGMAGVSDLSRCAAKRHTQPDARAQVESNPDLTKPQGSHLSTQQRGPHPISPTSSRKPEQSMPTMNAFHDAPDVYALTDRGRPGLANRLNSFSNKEQQNAGRPATFTRMILALYRMLRFFLCDVMPAIRSRRIVRREDIISHLIDQGYSNREILIECITYGAAGVATTRELMVVAAWHLFDRMDLRMRFLNGDEADRIAILEEVLRLEPVVDLLYRRAEQNLILDDDGRPQRISAGTLLAIEIRAVHADPAAAGFCPHRLDPNRRIEDHRFP